MCDLRLVDDSHHIESCNGASILGGLPLCVVEVRRDSDHGMSDLVSKVCLCNLLHLGEDHGTDLLRCEGGPFALDVHLDVGFVVLLVHLEGPVLDVMLNRFVVPSASN